MQTHNAVAPVERRTDTELIAAILSGDLRALEKLMRLHNRALYRTARAILRDDGEAEDAVQEAWLKAHRALGTFRGGAKLSTWLVRIAANEALMRRRSNARTPPAVPIDGIDVVSSAPGPEREAQDGQTRRMLEERIDALPDDFRAVFVLRALEELDVAETAAALGIPEATVRTRFFRARGLLRESLGADARDAFAFAGARCDRIVRRVLAVVVLAVAFSACSEKPPRPDPEGEQAYNNQNGDNPLRERTLKQGESDRMSY